MVQAIEFAVRNSAGAVVHGTAGGGGANFVQIGSGEQVSLHLSQSSVLGYERKGADLIVKLVDGSDLTLSGFYNVQPGHMNRLYLSANGEVTEVLLQDAGEGPVVASYGPVDAWNKFSTLDDLRFEAGDAYADSQIYSDEPAGMGALAPGLLGAGGLGAAAIAAGLLGGAALLGGGGGDGGNGGDDDDDDNGADDDDDTGGDDDDDTGGDDDDDDDNGDDDDDDGGDDDDDDGDDDDDDDGDDDDDNGDDDDDDDDGGDDDDDNGHTPPTVDNPNADSTLTTNTTDPKLVVTGTGHPGDTVVVTIGDKTQTTTIGTDGKWGVEFKGPTFPKDGDYSATVKVTGGGQSWTLDGPDFLIDMTPPPVKATVGVESVGDIENASEYRDGVTIGGTSEAGATVKVTIDGKSHSVVANSQGKWSVTFTTSEIASGEHTVKATITATDPLGNATTITENVVIDTEINVALDAIQMGDNVISGAEKAAAVGVSLTGTGDPGDKISVVFEGVTRTTTVGADGKWSVKYLSGEFRPGTYNSTATVTATDAAGNTQTDTHVVKVDTEVKPLSGVADAVINASDAANDLAVTGKVEVGSRVMVKLGNGQWHAASVDAEGNWTADIPRGEFPATEANLVLQMRAIDAYGNEKIITQDVRVDRVVNTLGLSASIGGDNVINAEEHAQGVKIGGYVEPNSTVTVQLPNGSKHTVTAGTDGKWSVTFTAGELPSGDGVSVDFRVSATDSVGNTDFFTETVLIDTVAPGSPEIIAVTPTKDANGNANGMRALFTEISDDTYTFDRIDGSGGVTHLTATQRDDTMFGETEFRLSDTVPDGSYLVINNEDDAGNSSSTLLIVNTTSSVDVDLTRAGLTQFDFDAVDLTWAPDAQLTITDTQLKNMTGPDNTLIIKGDGLDDVRLDGDFSSTGTQTIDGQTYTIYTLGDNSASILVDTDIHTQVI